MPRGDGRNASGLARQSLLQEESQRLPKSTSVPVLPPLDANWRGNEASTRLERLEKQFEPATRLSRSVRRELVSSYVQQQRSKPTLSPAALARRAAQQQYGGAVMSSFSSSALAVEFAVAEAASVGALEQSGDPAADVSAAAVAARVGGGSGALSSGEVTGRSREIAERCLEGLRRVASLVPPTFGPVLSRLADELEPRLFSSGHADDEGRGMSHEQVRTDGRTWLPPRCSSSSSPTPALPPFYGRC